MSGRDRIRGEGLSYTYVTRSGETLALQGLNLAVRDGEFCSIVGPSGCGKSTLLALISGLLRPTEGQILLDGSALSGPDRRVGILLQKDHLFEWRTVLENAELGLEIRATGTAEARRHAQQLLKTYGLGGFEQSYPHQLSGGMRQRVALIRTLATDPDILLLDEPFSALDYQTKLILERDVHRIIRQNGKTALLVTHDIEEAVSMSDRVIVLSGRPAQVRSVYDIALTTLDQRTPLNSRDAPEFRGYCRSIWEDLDIEDGTLSAVRTDGAVSDRHARFLRELRRRQLLVAAVQIALLVGFLGLWQIAVSFRLVDPFIVSQPVAIGRTLMTLTNEGSLGYHIAITVAETLVGFALGTVLGIFIAGMLWWWDFLSDVSDPYIVVLNATPKMALGPVFIIWLGATMTAVIALAISISLFVTILSVYSAFRQTDPEKLIVVRSFGASKWQQFRKVVFPQAVPTIVATLKVNIGLSLIGAIVGEFLAANAGLGYLIIYGQNIFNMSLVMTSLMILTVIAGLMYYAVSMAERVFVPWQHK